MVILLFFLVVSTTNMALLCMEKEIEKEKEYVTTWYHEQKDQHPVDDKLARHFKGKVFNIKEIYDDIPFLVELAKNNNHQAIMTLVYYQLIVPFIPDIHAYQTSTNPMKLIPWDKKSLSFFKDKPEISSNKLFWGAFYYITALKKKTNEAYETALSYFTHAAHEDNAQACYCLGNHYEYNKEDKNLESAFYWKQKAAILTYVPAIFDIGYAYLQGYGVDKDINSGIYYLDIAATLGYSTANFYLGLIYDSLNLVPIDYTLAKKYYLKAIDQGCLRAKHNLGILYLEGKGVNIDSAQGLNYIIETAAQEHAYSQFSLGKIYCEGKYSIKVDQKEGIRYLKRAARQEHIYSLHYLGSLLLQDNNKEELGIKSLTIAADKFRYPQSEYALGVYYLTPEKIVSYKSRGLRYLTKAASHENHDALYTLGTLYYFGTHVNPNGKKGFNLIRRAAREDHAPSIEFMQNLGVAEFLSKS